MRHLNWRQLADTDRGNFLLLFLFGTQRISVDVLDSKVIIALRFIIQLDNTPNTSAEKAIEFLRIFVCDWYISQTEIGKLSKIAVLFNIQMYRHHINDGMTSLLPQLGKNFLSFIRTDEIVSKNPFDLLNAVLDHFFIIGAAILSQQELQNINRDICTFFYFFRQVLADDLSVKILAEFFFYFFTGAFTLIHLFHSLFLLRCLTEEVELIHRKSNINLKFLTLRKLKSLFLRNHKIVGFSIAVF